MADVVVGVGDADLDAQCGAWLDRHFPGVPRQIHALNSVAAKLNDENMAKLNASVDVDKKTVEDVAQLLLVLAGAGLVVMFAGAPAVLDWIGWA